MGCELQGPVGLWSPTSPPRSRHSADASTEQPPLPLPPFHNPRNEAWRGDHPRPHRCGETGRPSTSPLASPSRPQVCVQGAGSDGGKGSKARMHAEHRERGAAAPRMLSQGAGVPCGGWGAKGETQTGCASHGDPGGGESGGSASHGSRHGASEGARVSGGHRCLEQGGEGDGLPGGWRRPTGGVLTWNGPGPAPRARRE